MNASEAQQAHAADVQKLNDMIRDIRVAMLTTVDERGMPHSRPMATQQTEFDGVLWFLTDKHAPKVDEVEGEHQVNLAYQAPDDDRYVSVSGRARLVQNRQKLDELWSPLHKAWFPEGKDDPRIGLLRVDVHHAEYWDAPSGKMVQLAGFVKALVTGKRYQGEGAENEKLTL